MLRPNRSSFSVQDTLANALHETHYLFGQLQSAGIATIFEGSLVGALRQGGFSRGSVPDFPTPEELAKHKPTGIRACKTEGIRLNRNVTSLINKLLANYPYYEKPHDLLDTLGRQDYILHLYNFYPQKLLQELGIANQSRIRTMLQITQDINRYSRNKEDVTTQGAKISVIFEPSSELNSRLNDEREFRFVEVPTDEGKQDADNNEEPTNNSGNENPLNDNDGF